MPLNMSRRKQSNPKPLKAEGDDEETQDSSSTPPTPDVNGEEQAMESCPSPSSRDGDDSPIKANGPVRDEPLSSGSKMEWPVKRGTILGPFCARVELVAEERERSSTICVRGTSGSVFSIFILEMYSKDVLSKTHITPVSKDRPRAALVYIYKPDKQLYLVTLCDIDEKEEVPTLFLERGQDRHPQRDDIGDLIDREVEASHRTAKMLDNQDGQGATSPLQSNAAHSPGNPPVDGMVEPIQVPSVSCQSCGVSFRNPANLSAHQLYYCAARETVSIPAAPREHSLMPQSAPEAASQRGHSSRHPEAPKGHSLMHIGIPEAATADNSVAVKERGRLDDLVCILCKATFTNLTNCLNHMVKLHTEHNSQACKCCNFISGDIKLLKEHMLIHVRGSGINPNVFMPSQTMGPLSVQGIKDSRHGDNRRKSKSPITSETISSVHQVHRSSPDEKPFLNNSSPLSGTSPRNASTNRESSPPSCDSRRSPVYLTKEDLPPMTRYLCEECDIFFSSYKNFVAHKQFYCQGHKKEATKLVKIPSQPAAPPPLPFVQCTSCMAIFPTRDKLAVHTLYFCPYQKGSSHSSDESIDRASDIDKASPKTGVLVSRSNSEKGSPVPSSSSTSAEKPKIKVEREDDQSFTGRMNGSPRGNVDKNNPPYGVSLKTPVSPTPMPTGPVLLAPGNVPRYMSPGGATPTPVYILASHVFVTPQGVAGIREETPHVSYSTSIPGVPTTISGLPTGREMVYPGEKISQVSKEKPLDLSLRKRKASEEIQSFGGNAPKVIKIEHPEGRKSFPTSPIEHSASPTKLSPSLVTQNAQGQLQFKCPGCHITFNRFESLDVHRQFYCQSEDSRIERREAPASHHGASIPVPLSVPSVPYYQVVTSHVASSSSTLVPALATVNLGDSPRRPSSGGSDAGKSPKHTSETMDTAASPTSQRTNLKERRNQSQGKNVAPIAHHSGGRKSPATKDSSDKRRGEERQVNGLPLTQDNKGQDIDANGQRVPVYLPSVVRYMCPSCGVSFMKLESLSAHQQFYCRAVQSDAVPERTSPRGDVKGSPSSKAVPVYTVQSLSGSSDATKDSAREGASPTTSPSTEVKSTSHSDERETDEAMDIDVQRLSPKHFDSAENDSDKYFSNKSHESLRNASSGQSNNDDGSEDMVDVDGTLEDRKPCNLLVKQPNEPHLAQSSQTPKADPPKQVNNNLPHIKQEKLEEDEEHCSAIATPLGSHPGKENGAEDATEAVNSESASGNSDSAAPGSPNSQGDAGRTSSRHPCGAAGTTAGATGKPAPVMMKHCRACNINFTSLSTFIAHKKYYCASHHLTKNTVR